MSLVSSHRLTTELMSYTMFRVLIQFLLFTPRCFNFLEYDDLQNGNLLRQRRQTTERIAEIQSWKTCKLPRGKDLWILEPIGITRVPVAIPGISVIPLTIRAHAPVIGPISVSLAIERNIFFYVNIECIDNGFGEYIGSCTYQNICRREVLPSRFLSCRRPDDCICTVAPQKKGLRSNSGHFPVDYEFPVRVNVPSLPDELNGLVSGKYRITIRFHSESNEDLLCATGTFKIK